MEVIHDDGVLSKVPSRDSSHSPPLQLSASLAAYNPVQLAVGSEDSCRHV